MAVGSRQSIGPLQISSIDIHLVNDVFRQIQDRIDLLTGLSSADIRIGTHAHDAVNSGGLISHAVLTTLTTGDPHTQYRLESEDHSHQSAGLQAGTLDHGLALTGLSDDDHSLYLLASDATSRALFATNWLDLTDGGSSALHTHSGAGIDHGLLSGLADNDHPQYLLVADIDDVAVDGEIAQPISSNWAFDHGAATDPHTGYRLESADHNHQSTGAQAGQLDHGAALTGLADDDHTQYGLNAGRSGGQTHIGGTAAADGLTLQATAGVGAGSEFIKFLGGNNGATEIARLVGQQLLIGTTTAPSGISTDEALVVVSTPAVDGATVQGLCLETYGGVPRISARRVNGTPGSETAILTDQVFGNFNFRGYNGSAFSAGQASIAASATENWSSTANGCRLLFTTTPNTTTVATSQWSLEQDGALTALSVGSKIDLSGISAGNPNFKATFTTDTPTTTWAAGVPSTNPAGYIEWLVGATTYYQPLFT